MRWPTKSSMMHHPFIKTGLPGGTVGRGGEEIAMGLFNFWRRKSNIEITFETHHSNANPEDYTVVYEFGHVSHIIPDPGGNNRDKIGMIYDARHIISDGIQYDLTDIRSVHSISVPNYSIHQETQIDEEIGVAACLEYLLNNKFHDYYLAGNNDLAIACLEKSTQLMSYSDLNWNIDSFYEIVDKLMEMGQKSKAEKWKEWLDRNVLPAKLEEKKNRPLTYNEKEQIMVERVTTEDMLQFTKMPYNLNCPVHKFIGKKAHPFAYMNLDTYNQKVAKEHLMKLERMIDEIRPEIPLLKSDYYIDVRKVAFRQYDKRYGYSRLMCTPHTFTGKISKIPLTLLFMSHLNIRSYYFIGELKYNKDGEILTAHVSISREKVAYSGATFWEFIFTTVDGEFLLEQAKTSLNPDKHGLPCAVYKDQSLIRMEQEREDDMQNFLWLQRNLPSLCPKSLSGFRRMRTTNSKNYQKLVSEAAKLGKQL